MHLILVIFVVSFSTLSGHPLHHDNGSREEAWADAKTNHAHDKTAPAKNTDKAYKSHVDNTGLYHGQDDDRSQNPLIEEMRHKLTMESERLRARLRQELAELSVRLYPSSSPSAAALVRDRLVPLTQQLQASASSDSQDLCGRLSVYLRGLEVAEAQTLTQASPALSMEALRWMSQVLDHSGARQADILKDFHAKASGVIDQLSERSEGEDAQTGPWQEMRTRLGQEVSSLRLEAESRVGALKTKLGALLVSTQPIKEALTVRVDEFCQSIALQNAMLQTRIQRLLLGFQKETERRETPRPPSYSTHQPAGVLHTDFTAKLSALIQDILHSVQ